MAHAWWHPVGTTPLTEQQRWQGQGSDTAYDGPPDPGLENVYPELLLGGAGTLATRGAMKVAPPLWRLGRKAIKHTDPVTGNRVVRPGIQRTLAGIRNSIVRPGHAGGTRGPITRGVNKGPGTGRWGKPINPPNKTGSPTISRGSTSTPYGPRVGPLGYAIGGAGLGYAANKDEVDNMVSSYFADEPSTQETVEVTAVKPEDKKKKGPDAKNRPEENEINTPNLWETWGSLADNPKERKKAYLSSIKNIYMKKMLLDSIAKLTGGKSQGGAWAQMAIAELDAIEKFDSEERLHNQWKALFFREDGTYDPPKNRKEAMERGHQLGYDADQMKDIMSVFPKETDDRTGIEKNISYILSLEDGSMKRALMKRYGMIETDDLTAAERSADRAVRDGIITEKEREAYVRSIFVPTDASKDTAAMKNFEWYQEAEGEDKRLIGELLNIAPKGGTVDLFSPANIATLINSDAFLNDFSDDERARVMEIVRTMIPGFNAGLGVKTREQYEQEVRKRYPNASEADIQATVKAKYG